MHQQLWGYKVEWKSVSRGTGGKKVEYHWIRRLIFTERLWRSEMDYMNHFYRKIVEIWNGLHDSFLQKDREGLKWI
jgi:hypothetical protein